MEKRGGGSEKFEVLQLSEIGRTSKGITARGGLVSYGGRLGQIDQNQILENQNVNHHKSKYYLQLSQLITL
jgi:hypothetical protein